ncbi:hypothetical protein [Flavobacterium sp. N502540]|uniref:hypothetical protein n=1 Tax=Flavobacterium sp. N502540 TaxID=2986838 RepID=UPI0022243A3B|nr:hypothetical protein [Flavobacterium sp. N502540]
MNKTVAILITTLLLSFISCKKDTKIIDKFEKQDLQKSLEYNIDFPDTLYVNQSYEGILDYKSALDTIITTFGNKTKNRHTLFILTTTNDVNYDHESLKKSVKDTFGALNNREIPFYDIKFTSPGVFYIDGIIKDIISIDINKRDENGNELVRLIENEERVTHKVIVINRPVPKSNL